MAEVFSPVRTNRGRFAPGSSGCPGGRRGLPGDVREQLEAAAPEAVARLVELIRSEDERVALAACEALLSRVYGKPHVAVDATISKTTDIGRMHLEALQAIQERRQERLLNARDEHA